MASSSKRSTYAKPDEPLAWAGKPPSKITRWRIKPWQDIVALLGFALAMGVFVYLFMWGWSAGVFS